ncbi:hypothetical protein NOGI109294_25780 [Nocardiopsis gilva]
MANAVGTVTTSATTPITISAMAGSMVVKVRPRGMTMGQMTWTVPPLPRSYELRLSASPALFSEVVCCSMRVPTEAPWSRAARKSPGSSPTPSAASPSASVTAWRGSPPWAIDVAAPRTVCAKDILDHSLRMEE